MSAKGLYELTQTGSHLFIVSRRGWSLDDRELCISENEAKQLVRLLQGVLYEKRIMDDSDNA